MSDDPFERLRQGDEGALADLGYEIVEDDDDEYEPASGPSWTDDELIHEHEVQEERAGEITEGSTALAGPAAVHFANHVHELQRQTGVQLDADEFEDMMNDVVAGELTPQDVIQRFVWKERGRDDELKRLSQAKDVPAHVARNARRERMARAIDRANGTGPFR